MNNTREKLSSMDKRVAKLSKSKQIALSLLLVAFLVFFGRFVYFNLVAPWPYRHDLRACLQEARALPPEAESKAAENLCFRTYPHFN